MDDYAKALIETFRTETKELLEDLEEALLELESDPGNGENVNRVFRVLHTVKGNGSMFGFEEISRFTHDLEHVYEHVRRGDMAIDRRIIDLTLGAKDVINAMIQDPSNEDTQVRNTAQAVLSAFRELLPADPAPPERKGDAGRAAAERAPRTFRIRFAPEPDIFGSGTNPLLLIRELEALGQVTVIPRTNRVPELEALDTEKCYMSWDILLTTTEDLNAVRDVFIFVEDRCDLVIDTLDEEMTDPGSDHLRLGEILIERGDLSREELETVIRGRAPLGRVLVDSSLVGDEEVHAALLEQRVLKEVSARRREDEAASTVRVEASKLDDLVDLVGELVTVQARLSRTAGLLDSTELKAVSEMVEMLTWDLRDRAFSMRMVPIGTTFNTLKRTVRDLASALDREVELVTLGGDTELDKTVIERLRDPLVHIIRNSIDHGIEPAGERQKAGKSRTGTITLSASQAGADVVLRVGDDGAGLDEAAIREKALRTGLMDPGAEPGRRELLNLIFEPGFSTAREVTNLSGRGVGMDVVKRSVEDLRGSLEVESERGKGTEIVIRLPLTMAIIEGLQVDIAGARYIFPLSLVEECVELRQGRKGCARGRELTNLRGHLIPYIRLRDWFGISGENGGIEQIVVTRVNNARIGFVVDYVVGEHQTVIKSLGKVYRGVEGISGASVLGDGSVALILDVPHLAGLAEERSGGMLQHDSFKQAGVT